jgi:hypothetical protein
MDVRDFNRLAAVIYTPATYLATCDLFGMVVLYKNERVMLRIANA